MAATAPLDDPTRLQPLNASDIEFSAVSSRGVIEPAEDERVLLKYSTSRPLFLTRVGLHFVLVFSVMAVIVTWKSTDERTFNYWCQLLNLERNLPITISLFCFEKIFNGFFGFIWKGTVAKFVLGFHWIIHVLTIMIFFIFVENVWEDNLKIYPFLLRLILGALLLNSIVFVFCTLLKDNINYFRAWSSFWLLTFANWIYLYTLPHAFNVPPYGFLNYLKIAGISFGFNIFFVLNARFIVNYRTTKFYDDEDTFCYWAWWIDWFSFFWIDLFRIRKNRKEMTRMMQIKLKVEEKKNMQSNLGAVVS